MEENRAKGGASSRHRPDCSFRHVAAVARSQTGLLGLLPGEHVEELRHVGPRSRFRRRASVMYLFFKMWVCNVETFQSCCCCC